MLNKMDWRIDDEKLAFFGIEMIRSCTVGTLSSRFNLNMNRLVSNDLFIYPRHSRGEALILRSWSLRYFNRVETPLLCIT